MKLVIVGNNDGPLRLIKSLESSVVEILAVGLQKKASEELMAEYDKCTEGITLFSNFDKEAELLKIVDQYNPDVIINCFSNIIFAEIFLRYKVLNIHLSKLPEYKGRHPLHWALINGEKEIGITIHEMIRQIDGGRILWQETCPISEKTSVAEARELLMEQLEMNFPVFITNFMNKKLKPKENTGGFYLPRRVPEDSLLSEWQDREIIYRKIMALRSEDYPAFLKFKNVKVEVRNALKTDSKVASMGDIVKLMEYGVEVSCKNGNIILGNFETSKLDISAKQKIYES